MTETITVPVDEHRECFAAKLVKGSHRIWFQSHDRAWLPDTVGVYLECLLPLAPVWLPVWF